MLPLMLPILPFVLPILTTAATFAVKLAPAVLPLLFIRRPAKENPTAPATQVPQDAEKARNDARAAAKAAQDLAEQTKRDAEHDCERAHARQAEADRVSVRAAQEMVRMWAQIEEAAAAARRAETAAANAAREDAVMLAQEAQQERERCQKVREDAERVIAAAREEAKRAQQAAGEQRRAAEFGKAHAEEMARAAAEETRKVSAAKGDADRRWKEGIQPVVTSSPAEVAAAKRRIQYREDCFHFAVAGVSGSGKSSLVNAFRGLRSRDAGAAAVGVTEMTFQMSRYPDANPDNPFVWYDTPDAGTLKCRDWQYFNDQGLYVFDCIIVLFDNRFTMTDIAILTNARRFKIPTYIVRSKADQHIRNTMMEMDDDNDGDDEDEDDVERHNRLYRAAQRQFCDRTRRSVQVNLEDANLPNQRVYIVSSIALLSIVLNRIPKKAIDEVDLLNDLFNEAYRRRDANPMAG